VACAGCSANLWQKDGKANRHHLLSDLNFTIHASESQILSRQASLIIKHCNVILHVLILHVAVDSLEGILA